MADDNQDTYIFPLRDTIFEGVAAKIPYRYKDLLMKEYGDWSLTGKQFAGYEHFILLSRETLHAS